DSNLTLKEFTRLVNTDFNQALQLFLKGLNAGGKTTTDLSRLLGTLKLSSGEAKNVIVTLAQNTQLFADRQRIANEQLANGTSLAAEASIKNNNLAADYDKLKNSLTNLTTNSGLGALFQELIGETAERIAFLASGFRKLGDGIAYLREKLGLVEKQQGDYTTAIVANTNKLKEQSSATQKLLDSYTALSATTKRSAAQELELAETRNKLIVQFGTAEAAIIQKQIDSQKQRVSNNRTRLETDVKTYDAYIRSTQTRTAQLQEDANKAQLAFKTRFNLTPEGQKNVQDAAANNALLNSLNGRNFPKEQIDAARELNRIQGLLAASTKQLAQEQLKRSQALAALKKLSDAPVKPPVADAGTDTPDAETDALNKATKARALARKQDLENQLAYQKAVVDDTKKFQAEQAKLFDDQQITPGIYEERVRGTQDTINDAIREGGRIRLEIAQQERLAADADAREGLERVLSNEKKSYAERQDAQGEYFAKVDQDMRAFKGKVFQINRDIQEQLKLEPIEFKVVGIDTKQFLKGQDDIATSSDKTIQRLNDNIKKFNDKNDAQREIDRKNQEDDEQRRQDLIGRSVDFAIEAEQAFFSIRQQYDQKRIQDLEEAKEREVSIAGDNAELRSQIEADFDKKIRAAKKKAAKDDQQAAIFQILINTAISVAKTLAFYGFTPAAIPFVALAAGSGLLQLAAVKAAPLPQYFKGRKDGPSEWAQVAERGPELITGKSGGARLVEKPSITYLQQGDEVHTAERTREILRTAERHQTSPFAVMVSFQQATAVLQSKNSPLAGLDAKQLEDLMKRASIAGAEKVVQALKNQKSKTWDISPQGVVEITKQAGNLTREMKGRLTKLGLKG
ncbi:coiled-coil domain-containing protein, partial [Hymenobacter crusticola]